MNAVHQLCLVSNQLVPNLLPVLSGVAGFAPGVVTLVVTAKMAGAGHEAARLRSELVRRGVVVTDDLALRDMTDFEAMKIDLRGWLDAQSDENILLNITGGTKLMAIAAQEVFVGLGRGRSVFYVDIRSDDVFWLDGNHPPIKFGELLDTSTMLALYGLKTGPVKPPVLPLGKPASGLDSIFARLGLPSSRFILDAQVMDLENKVVGSADALAISHNSLYVLKHAREKDEASGGAARTIYELGQLAVKFGGLRGQGILITNRQLKDVQRAIDYGLTVVYEGGDLQLQLKESLRI